MWLDMLRLRSKSLKVSLNSFATQYEAKKKKEEQDMLFKNDNVQILK